MNSCGNDSTLNKGNEKHGANGSTLNKENEKQARLVVFMIETEEASFNLGAYFFILVVHLWMRVRMLQASRWSGSQQWWRERSHLIALQLHWASPLSCNAATNLRVPPASTLLGRKKSSEALHLHWASALSRTAATYLRVPLVLTYYRLLLVWLHWWPIIVLLFLTCHRSYFHPT